MADQTESVLRHLNEELLADAAEIAATSAAASADAEAAEYLDAMAYLSGVPRVPDQSQSDLRHLREELQEDAARIATDEVMPQSPNAEAMAYLRGMPKMSLLPSSSNNSIDRRVGTDDEDDDDDDEEDDLQALQAELEADAAKIAAAEVIASKTPSLRMEATLYLQDMPHMSSIDFEHGRDDEQDDTDDEEDDLQALQTELEADAAKIAAEVVASKTPSPRTEATLYLQKMPHMSSIDFERGTSARHFCSSDDVDTDDEEDELQALQAELEADAAKIAAMEAIISTAPSPRTEAKMYLQGMPHTSSIELQHGRDDEQDDTDDDEEDDLQALQARLESDAAKIVAIEAIISTAPSPRMEAKMYLQGMRHTSSIEFERAQKRHVATVRLQSWARGCGARAAHAAELTSRAIALEAWLEPASPRPKWWGSPAPVERPSALVRAQARARGNLERARHQLGLALEIRRLEGLLMEAGAPDARAPLIEPAGEAAPQEAVRGVAGQGADAAAPEAMTIDVAMTIEAAADADTDAVATAAADAELPRADSGVAQNNYSHVYTAAMSVEAVPPPLKATISSPPASPAEATGERAGGRTPRTLEVEAAARRLVAARQEGELVVMRHSERLVIHIPLFEPYPPQSGIAALCGRAHTRRRAPGRRRGRLRPDPVRRLAGPAGSAVRPTDLRRRATGRGRSRDSGAQHRRGRRG
jgi:hypothetical protein